VEEVLSVTTAKEVARATNAHAAETMQKEALAAAAGPAKK
jgi:hypothetical protein